MKNLINVSAVKDGSVISFPTSAWYYLKVCDRNGVGGVIRLHTGLYIAVRDLHAYGLDTKCTIVADDLDKLYYDEED